MKALAIALCMVATPVAAAVPTTLITDLSQARIDIDTQFKGADLLVFGAIQYPQGSVPDEPPDIAIVIRGPAQAITLRKKARVVGIWINTDSVRFETVPGFYSVATTAPIAKLADERTMAIYEIGVASLQLSPESGTSDAQTQAFERGLIALKRKAGLFAESPGAVTVTQGVLYRARMAIPSAVPVGDYAAEIYLIRHGRVLASSTTPISIGKSGFERWIYVAAQDHSLLYGLAAVAAALLAGWIASVVVARRG